MNKYVDIHFRLTEEEKETIEKVAKAMDKKVSEYARTVLLAASDYEPTIIASSQENEILENRKSGKKEDLHIRVSLEEIDYWCEQAKKGGISLSEYIRRSANGNQIVVIPGLKECTRQMTKVGININQLTTLAHQGRIREVDLFSCNDTLKQILQELIKMKRG